MPRGDSRHDPFETRRRKEQVAFLVVKFLRAHVVFHDIDREFKSFSRSGCLDDCHLFERVRELVGGLLFDLKENAHALFRSDLSASHPRDGKRPASRSSTVTRSLDSLIGTGYHLMLILQEALYQIERYAPELEKEKDDISARVAAETAEVAMSVMKRCRTLFGGTAEVIYNFIATSHDNEILVLNLVQNTDLLEKVYGAGSVEKVFSAVCRGHDLAGATAFERALSFVRARCGNTTAIPSAPGATSVPAAQAATPGPTPAPSPKAPARASAS